MHWVTPTNCTPTSTGWQDVDLDYYISGLGSDVTGAIIQINTGWVSLTGLGWRKNGSTDDFRKGLYDALLWAIVGVDSNHIFEIYLGNTSDVTINIVGYTTSGVTMFTNGYDKSISSGSWQDITCSSQAPGARGLIFLVIDTTESAGQYGMRKNGSTDARLAVTSCQACVVIGCDTSQICEGYVSDPYVDFYLLGYITEPGVVFNTNGIDKSLSTTLSWIDLSALSTGAIGGIIEVYMGGNHWYGLRKNGSSQELFGNAAGKHCWALPECDASRIVEGYITNTAVDFYEIGVVTPYVALSSGNLAAQLLLAGIVR